VGIPAENQKISAKMAPRRVLVGAVAAVALVVVGLTWVRPLVGVGRLAVDDGARRQVDFHDDSVPSRADTAAAPATCPPPNAGAGDGPAPGATGAEPPPASGHAVFALEETAGAGRQFTLDYYKGVEDRRAHFPNHNFVFAVEMRYPPFLVRPPQVDDARDLAVWASKPHQAQVLQEATAWCAGAGGSESALARQLCADRGPHGLLYFQHAYVAGSIDVFDHVRVGPHECGWMATPKVVEPLPAAHPTEYDRLASLDVPEGCAFQHFLDGVLPKLVAAWPVLRDPAVQLWIPACGHSESVLQLYDHLGVDRARLVTVSGAVNVRRFYSVCDVPGWHPILWRQMHAALRSGAVAAAAGERNVVIYLPRGRDAHNGRPVVNEAEVQAAVQAAAARHGLQFAVFERNTLPTVADVLAFFGRARLLVGMHGGALYNMMFAPAGLDIVEFVPNQVSFFLFHVMADMIGDRHWFLPTDDGTVPTDKLTRILDRALAPS
jgi:hypothetical protein